MKFYDSNEKPIISFGYFYYTNYYDDNFRLTNVQYLGTNDEPVMGTFGYSSYKINYNENGTSTTNYYDDKGNEINKK